MSIIRSAETPLLVSRSAARERFRDALRLYVGRGRRFSVKQVSNGTGIKDRMLEAFMAPVDSTEFRKPDLEELLTLAMFLGAEFSSEWLSLAEQGAYELPEDDGTPPGALAADMSDDAARVTRLAVEGAPASHPDLRAIGRREMARGAAMYRRAA